MNLIANPCFQIAQRGVSFPNSNSAYTLDRWVSLADAANRINVSRAAPLGCKIEFNSTGWGGKCQPLEHDQLIPETGRAKKLSVTVHQSMEGEATIYMGVFAWSGTVDKPTLAPIAAFGASPTLASGWSIVAWEAQTIGDRNTIDFTVPDCQNLAAVFLFEGAAADWFTLHDVSMDRTADFESYVYADELRRCSWFYQFYGKEMLFNCEWGSGRKDPGGFVSFQFPLSFPLRGRLGGNGTQDIIVDWPVTNDGYWHYASGAVAEFPAPPEFHCHHRHFLLFHTPASTIASYSTTIFRHWKDQPNPYISFDAELKP